MNSHIMIVLRYPLDVHAEYMKKALSGLAFTGTLMTMTKLSRNDTCWCGSGKKYKKCHLGKDLYENGAPRRITAEKFRGRLKNARDIEGIRKAGTITATLLDELNHIIKPGITTQFINDWVHEETLKRGAKPAPLNYKGFPKSICTSLNECICHGIPGDRVLQEGDILNVDITCILNGYYGDSCRMYKIGTVSKEASDLVDATRECLRLGIDAVKPGNTTGDIGFAIESYATSKGYSVVRDFGGHGTGIEFHEDPHIHHFGEPGTGVILEPGMVFTIEPMVNIGKSACDILRDGWTVLTRDRSLSAQWEHTLAVTETGADILTASPKGLF